MKLHRSTAPMFGLALFTLLLAGCLERIETITVGPDASALLTCEFRGTPDDFVKKNDALPENGGAWTIGERSEKDADGKPRIVRTATLRVEKGGTFPATYATAGDERSETGLRFPTSVRVSTIGPYTYYDFTRTYPRRDEAVYRYHEKLLTETDEFRKMKGVDPSTLTDEQRTKLVRTLVMVEAHKTAVYIERSAAALELDGTWPQEIGLTLRQAALDFAKSYNTDTAAAALAKPDSPEREGAIRREVSTLETGLRNSVHDMMQKLSLPEAQRERFLSAAKREIALRQATEDFGDERWEVRLQLPGVICASNADKVENGVLVWEFTSAAFLDRNHVLRATSHVETGK